MTTPTGRQQLWAVMRSELRTEARAGDVLLTTLPFAVAALIVVALAVGADVPLLRRIGPGLFWALVVVFGSFVVLRRTHNDVPAHRDLLTLLGVDPVVRYLARATVSAALLLVFQFLLAPVAVVLYDPDISAPLVAVAMTVLIAVGLAALGTLATDLAAVGQGSAGHGASGRMALVPLLIVPLVVPLVLAAVQTQQAPLYQVSVVPWMLLALLISTVALLAGVLSARPLSQVAA